VGVSAQPHVALSLDLWFTTLWFEAQDRDGWRKERLRTLVDGLTLPSGEHPSEAQVLLEVGRLFEACANQGRRVADLDPSEVVSRIQEQLGAGATDSLEVLAASLSDAGLAIRPPRVNGQARALLKWLDARRIPVVLLTNTARRPDSWSRFLESEGLSLFRGVITSSRLGFGKPDVRAFQGAAHALDVPVEGVLHVGDCWHSDVEGARRSGCSVAWYQGLWSRYPDPGQLEWERAADDGDLGVMRIESLEDLMREELWFR
jgi:FMN phosphatase YigB (HAD superfamily)